MRSVHADAYARTRASASRVYWFEADHWLDGLHANHVIELGGVGAWWR